jgi:hypothetical protein
MEGSSEALAAPLPRVQERHGVRSRAAGRGLLLVHIDSDVDLV